MNNHRASLAPPATLTLTISQTQLVKSGQDEELVKSGQDEETKT
jgi:hypothetical protein